MNTTVEILSKAKDYFKVHGGHKGSYYGPDETVCAMGALDYTCRENHSDSFWQTYDSLADVVEEQYPDRINIDAGYGQLGMFNDNPNTTKEEVIAVFEKAIVKASEIV